MIAGLEGVTSGQVAIGGDDVTSADPSDRGVTMVFQSYALYPHMSVYDNMAFSLKMNGASHGEIDSRVRKAADIWGFMIFWSASRRRCRAASARKGGHRALNRSRAENLPVRRAAFQS